MNDLLLCRDGEIENWSICYILSILGFLWDAENSIICWKVSKTSAEKKIPIIQKHGCSSLIILCETLRETQTTTTTVCVAHTQLILLWIQKYSFPAAEQPTMPILFLDRYVFNISVKTFQPIIICRRSCEEMAWIVN